MKSLRKESYPQFQKPSFWPYQGRFTDSKTMEIKLWMSQTLMVFIRVGQNFKENLHQFIKLKFRDK